MLKLGIIVGSTRPDAKPRPSQNGFVASTSAALKNAIDFLDHEWNNKVAGFVGYGGAGGVRAVENLRLVMGEIKIADVRAQVSLLMWTDFENFMTFKPQEQPDKAEWRTK